MIDRPLYKTWHVWCEKSTPTTHQDVRLSEGESVGVVIGNRRIVVSVDEYGRVSTKVQKRVAMWQDIED